MGLAFRVSECEVARQFWVISFWFYYNEWGSACNIISDKLGQFIFVILIKNAKILTPLTRFNDNFIWRFWLLQEKFFDYPRKFWTVRLGAIHNRIFHAFLGKKELKVKLPHTSANSQSHSAHPYFTRQEKQSSSTKAKRHYNMKFKLKFISF